LHIVRRSPDQFGIQTSRWTLTSLLAVVKSWLRLTTLSGLWQLLKRLKITYKRGRYHVHSPDPNYVEKLRLIRINLLPDRPTPAVIIFEDEFTLYRHPSLAKAFEVLGKQQPLAELGYKSNYTWRYAAGLNAFTGQVIYVHGKYTDVTLLTKLYQQLVEPYLGNLVSVVEDNWSVHYHPDLLAALQPQSFPWGVHRPANWKTTPRRRIEKLNLPIRLLFLPTYASWANPIEKLWRLLRQDVLHLHRYSDDWTGLKQRTCSFLDQFNSSSYELLRYVGLRDPSNLYRSLFSA
jgi:hypothetical protein